MSDWYAPLARALPALAVAIVITFSADHSATLGLVSFGLFSLAAALATAVIAWRRRESPSARVQLVLAALGFVAGVVSLVGARGGVSVLAAILLTWAVISGGTELWWGIRSRNRDRAARDRRFSGALTLLFAAAVALVPPGLEQPFGGSDSVSGVLTASIVIVGLLGAYSAVLGVFLVIESLSHKWAATDSVPYPKNGA